ncbi:hypothetical protein L1267_17770 [Pseudoalteromonas sp. OFAV1]|uniref:hypothetical protein n=1 Tax=Pseudoalteromonas sp. OFAV1 TaxID=2908892 RepID=UPI001F405D6C|nr:hypothetical protein [Pseudoalteromonas sp. OFAV1]MCF2902220.1 hypothetical protein [Pseudoalteromonas sp. OFAV1]
MIEIKPFVPKIVELLPNGTKNIFDNIELYRANRGCYSVDKTPHYACRNCGEKFKTIAESEQGHCSSKWVRHCEVANIQQFPTETLDEFDDRVAEIKSKKYRHSIYPVAQVVNELGDTVDLNIHTTRSYSFRRSWAYGRISPDNRGLLEHERYGNEWQLKYIHAKKKFLWKWYRSPKTTNERRQYDACIAEELAPRIRAKRHKNRIVNAWDDISLVNQRNWKQRKVKKQYMVNL